MDRPKCESDYNSPPDPNTIDRNMMWMKHFVKGIAEGIPNWLWLLAFQALNQVLTQWHDMKIMKIDNLNEAYWKGREFSQKIFGEFYAVPTRGETKDATQ